MAKFNILVTRDCTETTTVDVEAVTLEEAKAKALEEANNEPWSFEWVHDDNSGDQSEPYVTGSDAE
jgi:hypothetical protein